MDAFAHHGHYVEVCLNDLIEMLLIKVVASLDHGLQIVVYLVRVLLELCREMLHLAIISGFGEVLFVDHAMVQSQVGIDQGISKLLIDLDFLRVLTLIQTRL